jgi:ribosomal protein L31
MHFFGAPNLSGIHSTSLDPKWSLGVFQSISLPFGTKIDAIVVFRAWLHYFEVSKLRCIHSTLVDPKWRFGSVLDHFANLQHIRRWNSCVSGLNALLWGIEVAMHPFYSGWPKMTFGSVLDHFANLRHIRRCNSCVSGLNALFWGIEVAMHPFYSGSPKMTFGSVLDHFANLWTWKDEKLMFSAWMHYFRVAKLRSIHSTTFDPKWCLGVFWSISLTFGT